MVRQYFGTDGIRGKTGVTPITPEFFVRLGYAAGVVLTRHNLTKKKPSVVIGKDTRISGYMLESALEAGFSSAGVDVFLTGPLPTPAIAFLTRELGSQVGVVISASHNPHDDNGVKLFSSEGIKLSDEIEHEIELLLNEPMNLVSSKALGKAKRVDDGLEQYSSYCKSTIPKDVSLERMTIILDCAHGATYQVAPKVFSDLGAKVIAINNKPDGFNINDGAGSIHPEVLQKSVLDNHADLGIAFDGDGDRVIMVDAEGHLADGDQLLFLILQRYLSAKIFKGGVVGTLMTNLAFEEKCQEMSIPFYRANVGDRYVSESLRERNWILGGENSGHILTLDLHSTGDGIISALQVLSSIILSNQTLKQALQAIQLYPQILINIPLLKKINLDCPKINDAIKEAELLMNGKGRILIRESGTQALVRVMTEGPVREDALKSAEFLVKKIKQLKST